MSHIVLHRSSVDFWQVILAMFAASCCACLGQPSTERASTGGLSGLIAPGDVESLEILYLDYGITRIGATTGQDVIVGATRRLQFSIAGRAQKMAAELATAFTAKHVSEVPRLTTYETRWVLRALSSTGQEKWRADINAWGTECLSAGRAYRLDWSFIEWARRYLKNSFALEGEPITSNKAIIMGWPNLAKTRGANSERVPATKGK